MNVPHQTGQSTKDSKYPLNGKPMITIVTVLLAIVCAVLYRMGGASGYNTKFRDLGCPTVLIVWLLINKVGFSFDLWKVILAYFLTFGLTFGSLTTYWKKKGTDARWYNWAITGGVYGLACLPLMLVGITWYWILCRAALLASVASGWSEGVSNDVWEEVGRGVFIIATLPILLA